MTKIIGLTGGIGSGKTTVAKFFEQFDIPVFYADEVAKSILNEAKIQQKIANSISPEILVDGKVDKAALAKIVFSNPEKLQVLNSIIHPEVGLKFSEFLAKNKNAYAVVKEAAILFETGTNKNCDYVITVTAPKEVRISRVMKRDNVSEPDVLNRMKNQWSDELKISKSDYVIHNNSLKNTLKQVEEILKKLKII